MQIQIVEALMEDAARRAQRIREERLDRLHAERVAERYLRNGRILDLNT